MIMKKLYKIQIIFFITLLYLAKSLAQQSNTNTQSLTVQSALGTAFVVAEGYLITAQHVVQDSDLILIGPVQDNKWTKAKLIKSDLLLDLALLSSEVKAPALTLANWQTIPLGLEVFSIGFPQPKTQGFGKKITQGILNGNRTDKAQFINSDFFQYSAETQVGNSGGPLIGPDCAVIGITLSKLNALSAAQKTNDLAINVSYGLKSSKLLEFLSDTPAKASVKNFSPDVNYRAYQIYARAEASVFAVIARKAKPTND